MFADKLRLWDEVISFSVKPLGRGRGNIRMWEGHSRHWGRSSMRQLHRRWWVGLEHWRLLRGRGKVGRLPSEHARYGRGGVWKTEESRLSMRGRWLHKS